MEINYAEGTVLAFWYDTWLVLVGFVVALALAIMVMTRGSWRGTGLAINSVMVLAVLAGLPLTMLRIGIDIAVTNYDAVGYISLVGAAVALVVGLPYLGAQVFGQRVAPAEGVSEIESITPEQGVTVQLGGQQTAAEGVSTVVGGQAMAGAPTAFLHFKSGPRAGQSIPLGAGTISIGRGPDNDVVMDDPTVSRQHARITYHDGQYFVEDAGSMSGTLVEGVAATRTLLSSGASVQMGETEVVFMEAGPSTAAAAASGTPATAGPQRPAETIVMGQPEGVMAWLAVTAGPEKGKTYQLKVGDNTIGRDADNDLVIQDASVSRSHAMIRVQEGSFLLVDLGSSSGTRVGGRTLEGGPLKTGAVINVGQTQLSLVQTEGQDRVELATMTGQTVVVQPGEASGGVLVAQSGPDSGKSFALAAGDNLIGREPDSKVLLTDGTVSRRHALIRKEQDRFVIFDLGSESGTRVDGESMSGHRLSPGETISVGRSEVTLMQMGSKEQ